MAVALEDPSAVHASGNGELLREILSRPVDGGFAADVAEFRAVAQSNDADTSSL